MTQPLPSYLQSLNPPQLEATIYGEGPLLVLAGAGSGKTRVLTHRIAHLILSAGVRPFEILAVTFTNKAAGEMRERLTSMLGETADRIWISTFHSACLNILRRHAHLLGYQSNFVIYDDSDQKNLLKQILKRLGIDEKKHSINMFRSIIDKAKNDFILPDQYEKRFPGRFTDLNADVYQHYQRDLLQSNAMDFGDLLVNTLRVFKDYPETVKGYQERLRHVLVDEFQDTNFIQYELIKLLTKKHQNILVVGDDDQSIYAFRGATVEHILSFERDFPSCHTVTLEQNYRSTGNILEAAHAVISKNENRKPKKLWTELSKGEAIDIYHAENETVEARFVAKKIKSLHDGGMKLKNIAIFYRTNAQSRALEEALASYGLAYRIYGGQKFYDRKEIKDILAYLKLLLNPSDNQSFLRVVNTPPRGIGITTVQSIVQHASDKSCSLWNACQELATENKKLAPFTELIRKLISFSKTAELSELVWTTVELSGYLKRLEQDKDPSAPGRIDNLKELRSIASTMRLPENSDNILQAFLDRASLASSADDKNSEDEEAVIDFVSLMTLHLAKGLEFAVVFFTGLEEGLAPHYLSLSDPQEMQEERRLCYVGVTRAKQKLYLSHAHCRGMFSKGDGPGTAYYRTPSRFLDDIPTELLNVDRSSYQPTEIDYDSSLDPFSDQDWSTSFNKPGAIKKSTNKTLDAALKIHRKNISTLVTTADSLSGNGKTLAIENISPGKAVMHPSFGKGVVEMVEHDPKGNSKKSKVHVFFDDIQGVRKLQLHKARLQEV